MVMNYNGMAERAQLVDDADVPALEMTEAEAILSEKEVVPFPNEHHMDLGLELMNVFDTEIAFFLHPGTGQMAKAILMKNQHAVCVCVCVQKQVPQGHADAEPQGLCQVPEPGESLWRANKAR